MQKGKQRRRKLIHILLVTIVVSGSCRQDAPIVERARVKPADFAVTESVNYDLDEIIARGKITALTLNSSSTYFVYRGHAMGYEYELLSRFAKSIGVELEIKIIPDVNAMFDLLNKGEGDIIACNLAITKDRLQEARFSRPYNFTRQVLVQRLPEGWENMNERTLGNSILSSPIDLIGKKVYVNRTSSFFSRLHSLENEIGGDINIVRVPGYIDTEKLIQRVANGEIDYTVSDDNIAHLNATYYPNIDVSVQLSFPQQVGWAIRHNSPMLLGVINDWFEKNHASSTHAYIYNKYFKATKEQWEKFNGEYSSLQGNRISDYDELLQEYSKIIDWDWRLLAAQMYQESKFREDALSWAGAFGLMQLMPATAAAYGVRETSSPEEQIRAAILYLSWLDDYWKERIFDDHERVHFILASYNAGMGHVRDAMNLAESLGYNPLRWKDNVAECMLLKSQPEYYNAEIVKYGYCRGREPYEYVQRILAQYEHYKKVIS